jgi:Fumarylacetoacetate (FAA) hydrolase family
MRTPHSGPEWVHASQLRNAVRAFSSHDRWPVLAGGKVVRPAGAPPCPRLRPRPPPPTREASQPTALQEGGSLTPLDKARPHGCANADPHSGGPPLTRTEEARGSNPLTSTPPVMTSGNAGHRQFRGRPRSRITDADLLTVLVLRHGSPRCVRLAAPLTFQFDLDPGEVIVAGTPSGVALGSRSWLRPGDSVEATLAGCTTRWAECSDLVTPDEA